MLRRINQVHGYTTSFYGPKATVPVNLRFYRQYCYRLLGHQRVTSAFVNLLGHVFQVEEFRCLLSQAYESIKSWYGKKENESIQSFVKEYSIHRYDSSDYPEIPSWKAYLEWIKPFQKALKPARMMHAIRYPGIRVLKNAFSLTDEESELMLFFHLFHDKALCRDIVEEWNAWNGMVDGIAYATGIPCRHVKEALQPDSTLRSYGLVDVYLEESVFGRSFFGDFGRQPLGSAFKPVDTSDAYDLSSYPVDAVMVRNALSLLVSGAPVQILLHGKAGSGKSQFARSLAKQAGFQLLRAATKEPDEYMDLFSSCFLKPTRPTILLFDEADTMLDTAPQLGYFGSRKSNENKGIVNVVLDKNKSPSIWIVNDISQIDISTKRRMAIDIGFGNLSPKVKESYAVSHLKGIELSPQVMGGIIRHAVRANVSGATFDYIRTLVREMQKEGQPERTMLERAYALIDANSLFLSGSKRQGERPQDIPAYREDVLRTSVPLDLVERVITRYYADPKPSSSMAILLYGPSGTGKSVYARHVAAVTNHPCMLYKVGDLLNKFVGETEGRIRQMFKDAETEKAILVLDEADTFLSDRKEESASWGRSMINQFLASMEEYRGVLFCTTNLRELLDQAMPRRFAYTIEFKPLDKQGIATLWHAYWPGRELPDQDLACLSAAGTLAPGDFARIQQSVKYLDEDAVTTEYLVGQLQAIASEKGGMTHRRIGFQ